MYDRYYLFQIALDYIRYIQSPMTTCPFLGVLFVPHLFGCILLACQTSQIRGLQVPDGFKKILSRLVHLNLSLAIVGLNFRQAILRILKLCLKFWVVLQWLGRSDCRSECCRCNLATLEVTLHWTAEVLLSTGHVGNANQSAINYMCSPDKASPVLGWRYKPWMCLKELERPTNTWEMICFGPGNFENWNFASFLVALILTQCVWLASSGIYIIKVHKRIIAAQD